MANRQALKGLMTNQFITWYVENGQETLDYADALRSMWVNCRPSGGMRLTPLGYAFVTSSNVSEYAFDLDKIGGFTNHSLFLLDKKLSTPYYVHLKGVKTPAPVSLSLFGSEEAMTLTLHGNLREFLELL